MKTAEDCIMTDQGTLGGYCAKCGLMRMKHEKGPCPKCGETKRTNKKTPPAGQIFAVGHTRFTQYTPGNEAL
jgi:hypothetical protein